ncbi:MAG: penicillin-binding protein 2 [Chloroflexota bacterium]
MTLLKPPSRSRFRWSMSMMTALVVLTTACGYLPNPQFSPGPTVTPTDEPTPTPVPTTPEAFAAAFLEGWESGQYATMYALLSPESQAAISAGAFTQRYQNALTSASVMTVTTRLKSVLREGEQATAEFDVTLETALFGTLTADNTMSLRLHSRTWRVDWDAGLIWPELAADHYFRTNHRIPLRADIYDQNGLGLATQGTVVTVGVIPGQIADEPALLEILSSVTGLATDVIRSRYASANPDWKVPIADIPAHVSVEQNEALASLPGLYREEKQGRTYPYGEVTGHVVGWVAPMPVESLTAYQRKGYRGDETVGVAGLEGWGEEILAGQHGGTLFVVTGAGETVAEVSQRSAVPGRSIYTTLDRGFQEQVQQILGDRKGAIAVLDVDSGAMRALVSGPGFDPNVLVGPVAAEARTQVLTDPRHPLFNRATQGVYPTGSVFKIVTMSAGMEAAGLDPLASTFHCPGYWDGLGVGARKYCWKAAGHGQINLQDGLTASCNVTFYNVGKTLHELDPEILPQFGTAFGLGQPTGLEGLVEEEGLMPRPEWKRTALNEAWYPGDTVNLAIGQGYMRATPLQVAGMMSAVANGGTLYRPFIVQRIEGNEQHDEEVTERQAVRTLPVSAEHLAALQEGLLGVTSSTTIGTASHRFSGLEIPVAGKTGTAEAGAAGTAPHSWFAAYAPADNPEIALAVMVENAGEGSTVAAPLARQVIEAYFGLPLSELPPEAQPDYTPPTPTPEP